MKRGVLLLALLLCQLPGIAQSIVSFYVFAHPDDWQLFMGLDAYNDIIQGNEHKVVLIQIGAGELDKGTGGEKNFRGKKYLPYYLSRLSGSKKAVQFCADVRNPHAFWSNSTVDISGHKIKKEVYKNVVMYTLLLSDGDAINRLCNRSIQAGAIDGSTKYANKEDLVETIQSIFLAEAAGTTNRVLHVTDPDDDCYNIWEHKDHKASATVAIAANMKIKLESGTLMPTYAYLTYHTKNLPVNLTAEQLAIKGALFGLTDWGQTENNQESTMQMDKANDNHIKWTCRQYKRRFNYLKAMGDCSGARKPEDPRYLSESEIQADQPGIVMQPNPATTSTNIICLVPEAGKVRADLYDQTGRFLANVIDEHKDADYYVIPYSVQNLLPGTYIIKLVTPSGSSSFKFLKQ